MSSFASRCLLSLLSVLAITSAQASDWLLIGAEGDGPPNRRMTYSEFKSFPTRLDIPLEQAPFVGADALIEAKYFHVPVVQVLEAPDAPNVITYTVDVHCGRKKMRFSDIYAYGRDSRVEQSSQMQWEDVPRAGWPSRVFLIACDREKFEKAANTAAKGNIKPLTDLGMIYVGNYVLPNQLADITWTEYWKDGQRPALTSTLTDAELEAKRQEVLALADHTQANLENAKKEAEFMLEVSDNFDRKSDDQKNAFAGMQGWTEAQVIDAWGAPASSAQGGQTRSLVYAYDKTGYDVVSRNVDIVGSRGKVGETSVSEVQQTVRGCQRVLQFRQGGKVPGWRLYDFSYDCP